jgi:hypothetical protein
VTNFVSPSTTAVIVIDTLSAAPCSWRHLPGTRNLVIDDVDEQTPQLLPEKDASIVTYFMDASCGHGEVLAERLEQPGYGDVCVYRAASRTGWARNFL